MRFLNLLRQNVKVIMYICYITLVFATLIGVASRVLPFVDNVAWGFEVSRYAMIWLVMLINSVNIKERDEIVVQVLITRVGKGVRKIFNLICDVLVIFFLVIMLIFGFKVMISNWAQSSPALGIPMLFPYICMPLGALAMLIEKVIVFVQDIHSKDPILNKGEEVYD